MKYTDQQRLEKIYDNATKLHNYIIENNITKDQLLREETLQWLVTTPLYNIGEHHDDTKSTQQPLRLSQQQPLG